MSGPTKKGAAAHADGWLFKSWDNEAVLFNTASGDTHYLRPLTLALYETCRDHPGYTVSELTTALAARLGVAESASFREAAEETLHRLHQIGLLETA